MAKAKKKTRAPKPPREIMSTVADLVGECFSNIEELKDELESWRDGLVPSKQGSSKNDELDEAINQLEASSEPTIPDDLAAVGVIYFEPTGRRRTSRPARRDDCVKIINAVIDKLNGLDTEGAEELRAELENARDEWEACEFPGMFG